MNALDTHPAHVRLLLLTTNRGFWRIDPANDTARRVRATVSADGISSPVGMFPQRLEAFRQ